MLAYHSHRPMSPDQLLTFWFADAATDPHAADQRYPFWFEASPDLDAQIRARFCGLDAQSGGHGLDGWQTAARPCLALVIALDQLPRNLFRGTPAAFGTDPQARRICQHGLEKNYLAQFTPPEQAFFLMPLQHAEDIALQEESVRRCQALLAQAPSDWRTVLSSWLDFARKHLTIIQRFGRFPHRNVILGRRSTPDEQAFLDSGSGSFGQAPAGEPEMRPRPGSTDTT